MQPPWRVEQTFNIHANRPSVFLLLIQWICIGVKVHWSLPHHIVLAFWMESVVWVEYCCSAPQSLNTQHWSLLWWHFPGMAPGSGHRILWRLRPSYRTTLRSHTRSASPMKQKRWELTWFSSLDHFTSHDVFMQEHVSRHSVFLFLPLLCVTSLVIS